MFNAKPRFVSGVTLWQKFGFAKLNLQIAFGIYVFISFCNFVNLQNNSYKRKGKASKNVKATITLP